MTHFLTVRDVRHARGFYADRLGGRVVMERATIPGVGDLVFVADPSGNVVGVIQYVRG